MTLAPTTASLFTHNGAHLAYALPVQPRALLLVAHGCRNSGRNWFASAPEFGKPLRSSLPEESCVSAHAVASGFAVIAPTSTADCWSAADLSPVADLISKWLTHVKLPQTLPLLAYGTSSGGYFAHLASRHWANVAAVSMTVMVPPINDLSPPLPRGRDLGYPPLQLIYMQRDHGKVKQAQEVLSTSWDKRDEVEGRICAPRLVHPLYFTERAGLTANHSRAIQAELLAAGYLKPDGNVAHHPQRGTWRAVVQAALPKKDRWGLPQRSLQVAMDAVFQELDVAYGYHAATCEHIQATLAFYERHLPKPDAPNLSKLPQPLRSSKGGRRLQ
mmetsp:Transcript_51583/g.85544  ORF Transcript_51583/g.85544 Transcript_51583/m.85544 type:complete len:330 (-) Transcript_51583:456-1445(-)|eukprot:CAMPEP_0119333172 /NCGR_PEP_ID=MMETSP1333-20130426/84529_1 /TAXON_ID=418940 /ORGANISM="Scyphosphaera apsteinii, Strain RCC1455" /LENGTH=329 /DNA_ID=CAMNT_0007343157 /DNA_START=75 /DNA_END=1064 /DNA_ORIENTATION=+